MRVSIPIFPGSNCDHDGIHAWTRVLGATVTRVWHKDTDLGNPDLVFIPGGFSFGDYLRSGAIARFSPVMEEVLRFYRGGGHVLGICNGFQILCEIGLLPGALLTNRDLKFLSMDVWLKAEANTSPFMRSVKPGQVLRIPIAHNMGQYFADPEVLAELEGEGRVAYLYCDRGGNINEAANPNGSLNAIAGITSTDGRILGMMPHPERYVEGELGKTDGLPVLAGIMDHFAAVV